MFILGIDTSCDDTCIAVLKIEPPTKNWWRGKILSNIVSSQVKIHAKYGGVYPFLAKREHQRNLPIVLTKALKKANFSISNFKFLISKINPNVKIQIPKIDLVAVTVGPGLEPCLWTGINFARDLAQKLNLPIVSVNHIEAHILANWLPPIRQNQKPKTKNQKLFPAVCLVVSGGHTQLILMRDFGKYKLIGETRDDAAGECLDKVARILGLGYPGGPAIAKEAKKYMGCTHVILPRPMMYSKNYDFSFSGLKTAVLYKIKDLGLKIEDKKYVQEMCREVQQAIIDVLIRKTLKAAKDFNAKSIILGGGVAANDELRKHFKSIVNSQKSEVIFFAPAKKFCTDNAAMIALTAFFHRKKAKKDWPSNTTSTGFSKEKPNTAKRVEVDILGWQKIKANANLSI